MKKSAKIIAAIAATAIAGSAAVGGTLAWLTSKADVTNTFTFGTVNIKLTELVAGQSEGGSSRTESDQTYSMYPGFTDGKDPTVTVLEGSSPCYVFAGVKNTITSNKFQIDDNTGIWTGEGNNSSPKDTSATTGKWIYVANLDAQTKLYAYDVNSDGKLDDNDKVDANAADVVLDPLFSTIKVTENATNDDADGLKGNLIVKAYAHQAEKQSYSEAKGAAETLLKSEFAIQ